jgi:metal-responsive CopG/Arc/MetJ family transcriptional regulator
MTTNKPKLLFVIPQELLDRIDNFRFDNRINSRSEAVRRLIESGLESAKPKAKKK